MHDMHDMTKHFAIKEKYGMHRKKYMHAECMLSL